MIRYLALPRPDALRNHWIQPVGDNRNAKYLLYDYLAHPWYIQPTLRRRWGPSAWLSRLLGYQVPGDDGDQYHPAGYTITDVGPQAFIGKGGKEMDETRARLGRADRGGCPFAPL